MALLLRLISMDRLKQNREVVAYYPLPIRTRNNFAPAAKFSYLSACHPSLRSGNQAGKPARMFCTATGSKHPSVAEKGQTLVELMIAMSVMSIGFLGVFAVLSQSLGLNRVVANQYIAANLAAEGIEVVKNITDSNVARGDRWNDKLENGNFGVEYKSDTLNSAWANSDLKFDSAKGLYSYDVGTPTNFRRAISIKSMSGDNEMQVKSVVTWSDRGGTEFKVELEDRFFNWRKP